MLTARPLVTVAAVVVVAAFSAPGVPAQLCEMRGKGRITARFDVSGQTGNPNPLGVVELGGEIFVTAQGSVDPGTGNYDPAPPHSVYVFDLDGNLTRSFSQGSHTDRLSDGWRDAATDGQSLLVTSAFGIHVVDTTGNLVNVIQTANGQWRMPRQPIFCGFIPTCPFHGLAFDPAGNNGDGEWWAGGGSTLYRFPIHFDGGGQWMHRTDWNITGLALDPLSPSLWVNATANGEIVEVDRLAPQLGSRVRRDDPSAASGGLTIVEGGLEQRPAGIGGYDLISLELGVTGSVAVGYRLHLWDAVPCQEEPRLLTAVDGGPLSEDLTPFDPTNQTIGFDLDRPNRAYTAFLNVGPDAGVCGDLTYLGGPFTGLTESVFAAPFTRPPGVYADVNATSGQRVTIPVPALTCVPFGDIRVQALYVEPRLQSLFPRIFPVMATNTSGWRYQPLRTGILCEAIGADSGTVDADQPFWSVVNFDPRTTKAIVRLVLDWTTSSNPGQATMVFDTDDTFGTEPGSTNRFDGGNCRSAGCQGTYRRRSDEATALEFDQTALSACEACQTVVPARAGWIGSNPGPNPGDFRTLEFQFDASPGNGLRFVAGEPMLFDCDTEGGLGGFGGAMDGLVVTVTLGDGTVRSGELGADPCDPGRSFLRLLP